MVERRHPDHVQRRDVQGLRWDGGHDRRRLVRYLRQGLQDRAETDHAAEPLESGLAERLGDGWRNEFHGADDRQRDHGQGSHRVRRRRPRRQRRLHRRRGRFLPRVQDHRHGEHPVAARRLPVGRPREAGAHSELRRLPHTGKSSIRSQSTTTRRIRVPIPGSTRFPRVARARSPTHAPRPIRSSQVRRRRSRRSCLTRARAAISAVTRSSSRWRVRASRATTCRLRFTSAATTRRSRQSTATVPGRSTLTCRQPAVTLKRAKRFKVSVPALARLQHGHQGRHLRRRHGRHQRRAARQNHALHPEHRRHPRRHALLLGSFGWQREVHRHLRHPGRRQHRRRQQRTEHAAEHQERRHAVPKLRRHAGHVHPRRRDGAPFVRRRGLRSIADERLDLSGRQQRTRLPVPHGRTDSETPAERSVRRRLGRRRA